MVFVVFIVHVLRGRPPLETLLFSIALAVGLSPELLPAILSVNLARSARMMARPRRARPAPECHREPGQHGRAVHRQDRHAHRGRRETGRAPTTLEAQPSPESRSSRAWNAALETGLQSPLDEAILAARRARPDRGPQAWRDPLRLRAQARQRHRRGGRGARLVTKGAFDHGARGLHPLRGRRLALDADRAELA